MCGVLKYPTTEIISIHSFLFFGMCKIIIIFLWILGGNFLATSVIFSTYYLVNFSIPFVYWVQSLSGNLEIIYIKHVLIKHIAGEYWANVMLYIFTSRLPNSWTYCVQKPFNWLCWLNDFMTSNKAHTLSMLREG